MRLYGAEAVALKAIAEERDAFTTEMPGILSFGCNNVVILFHKDLAVIIPGKDITSSTYVHLLGPKKGDKLAMLPRTCLEEARKNAKRSRNRSLP